MDGLMISCSVFWNCLSTCTNYQITEAIMLSGTEWLWEAAFLKRGFEMIFCLFVILKYVSLGGKYFQKHPRMLTSIICSSFTTCIGPKSFSVLLRAVWWRITHNVLQQSSSWSTHLSEISPTRGKCAFSSKTTSTAPRRRGERRVRIFCCLTVKL